MKHRPRPSQAPSETIAPGVSYDRRASSSIQYRKPSGTPVLLVDGVVIVVIVSMALEAPRSEAVTYAKLRERSGRKRLRAEPAMTPLSLPVVRRRRGAAPREARASTFPLRVYICTHIHHSTPSPSFRAFTYIHTVRNIPRRRRRWIPKKSSVRKILEAR